MASTSALKVAEQIRLTVTEMLSRQINDPRLGFITITDVRLSKDWREAEVFYTVLGDEAARAETAAGLEAAKGQFRAAVARVLPMRFTPTLSFVPDVLPQVSEEFEQLLAQVKAADADIAAKAESAEFAGEPDPYKDDRPTEDQA